MSDLRPIRNTAHTLTVAAATLATAAVLAGCGTGGIAPAGSATLSAVMTAAPESNPAGDIPDNQAFVPFTPAGGLVAVSVPEGWARTTDGAATIFTDKSNTVRVETHTRATAPTSASVNADELPVIASSTAGYRPGAVSAVANHSPSVAAVAARAIPAGGQFRPWAVHRLLDHRSAQRMH